MSARATGAGLLAAAVLGTGCGGDDEQPADAPAPKAPAQETAATDVRIRITDFKYAPAKVRVKAGSSVTWVNEDDAPHTATAQDQSFDTDRLERSDRKAVKLDKPGSYRYYCVFHRFMEADVIVE